MSNTLRDIVEFRSERFAPVLPEDCQVNPEVYGAELAYWLCTELARAGVATSYPVAEDWGWFIEYSLPSGTEFAVHCGNVDGTRDRWQLSLRRFARKMFGRDMPEFAEAAALVTAIRGVLADVAEDATWQWDSLQAQ